MTVSVTRRAFVVVAACAVGLTGCVGRHDYVTANASTIAHTIAGTPSVSRALPPPSHLVDLGQASARVPVSWYEAPYRGLPNSLASADVFLSTRRFTGVCAGTAPVRSMTCISSNWFAPGSTTPRGGVLIVWGDTHDAATRGSLARAPGRRTVLAGRPAKISAVAAGDACPSGAAKEIDVQVQIYPTGRVGERRFMTACLGPAVSVLDQAAVYTMLRSLRISG